MKTAIVLILISLFSKPTCVEIDVMLVGDISGSVEGYEHFISEAFDTFIQTTTISDTEVMVGIQVFNDKAYTLTELSSDKNDLSRIAKGVKLLQPTGNTKMQPALYEAMVNLVGENSKGRYGAKKMIVIVSDGMADDQTVVEAMAAVIKNNNVLICCILIQDKSQNPPFLKTISSPSYYLESNYRELEKVIQKIDICI